MSEITSSNDSSETKDSLYYQILNVKPTLYNWLLEQLFNYDKSVQHQKLELDESDELLVDPQVYPSKVLASVETANKLQKAYSFCFYKKPLKTHINGNSVITKVLKSAYKEYISRTHNRVFKEGDYVCLKVNGRQFKILKYYENKEQYLLEQSNSKSDSRLHIIAQKQDIQHYNFK